MKRETSIPNEEDPLLKESLSILSDKHKAELLIAQFQQVAQRPIPDRETTPEQIEKLKELRSQLNQLLDNHNVRNGCDFCGASILHNEERYGLTWQSEGGGTSRKKATFCCKCGPIVTEAIYQFKASFFRS